MSLKDAFVGVLLGALLASTFIGFALFYQEFDRQHQQYMEENECIAKYISHGIERRDIVRNNGSCYVK